MLGPWPERVVVIVALAVIGFALVALPWWRSNRNQKRTKAA